MTNTIKLPQLAWYDPRLQEFPVPDSWQIDTYNMAGYNAPVLKPEQIKSAINQPIGTPTIRELAKNKKEVAIIFDDMSRVTRVYQIVPHILEELAAAGIPDNKIRFISALGCHGAMSRSDFIRKLGEDIVARFPVYNHNAFDSGCTFIGTTSQGLKVSVNAEVMKCDLKIGIGSIEPHVMAGFGGGSKIILPGVCSLSTNEAYHKLSNQLVQGCSGKPVGTGICEGNPVRPIIEEVGSMAGLNFKVDCLFNLWGEITHIFSGNPEAEYFAGAKIARDHYLSPRAIDQDLVIANTYLKVVEPMASIPATTPSVSTRGGDLVMINNSPEGHVVHFLMGTFGRQTGSPLWKKHTLPPYVKKLIIFSEYPDATFTIPLGPSEKIKLINKWDKVLELLRDNGRPGQKLKVAVYPNAEVQYFAPTSA